MTLLEKWKPIQGYEGRYEISTWGRVRSLARGTNKNSQTIIMADNPNTWGYPQVRLRKDGMGKMHRIHQLVANAFISNPKNMPEINHKNGVKADNRKENLEWCTKSQNFSHALKIGSHTLKLTEKQVREIIKNKDGLSQTSLGEKYGVTQSYVSYIRSGRKGLTRLTNYHVN